MNKNRSSQKTALPSNRKSPAARPAVTPWQVAVVVGVAFIVAGVLWSKGHPTGGGTAAATSPALVTPTGEGVAAAAEPVTVGNPSTSAPAAAVPTGFEQRSGESLEAYLDRMLEAEQPVFAFFHSYTCAQCVDMDKFVQQVYPDFTGKVALVDVNVYDDANRSLLQRARISVIPTLIFIDHAGAGQGYTGVMPAAQLAEKLTALSEGVTQ